VLLVSPETQLSDHQTVALDFASGDNPETAEEHLGTSAMRLQ